MVEKCCKLVFLILFVFCQKGYSQTTLENYKSKYPKDPIVVLKKIESVTIQIDDCNLDISIDHKLEKLSLSNNIQNLTDEYI